MEENYLALHRFVRSVGNQIKLVAFLIPIFVTALFAWNWVLIADDGQITHRYVVNFIETGKPYFNDSDRVFGLSSPGYFLILSGLSVWLPVTLAYKLIAFLAYFGLGLATVWIVSTAGRPTRLNRHYLRSQWQPLLIISAVYSANLQLVYWIFSGLETFFIPLCLVGIIIALRARSIPTIVAILALSIIFRLESWIVLAPSALLGIYFYRRQLFGYSKLSTGVKQIAIWLFIIGTIYAGVLIFILVYYDNIVPLSVQTKVAGVRHFPDVATLQQFTANVVAPYRFPINNGMPIALLVIAAVISLVIWIARKTSMLRDILVFGSGAGVFMLYLAVTSALHGWYFVVTAYAISVFFMFGAWLLITRHKRTRLAYSLIGLIVVLGVVSSANFGTKANTDVTDFAIAQMQVAAIFVENTFEPGSTVIVGSSGYFGRYAPSMHIVDELGLFTPDIVSDRKKGKFTDAIDLIPWDVWVCVSSNPRCADARTIHNFVAEFGTRSVIENSYVR